jgi:hypothetical protein
LAQARTAIIARIEKGSTLKVRDAIKKIEDDGGSWHALEEATGNTIIQQNRER